MGNGHCDHSRPLTGRWAWTVRVKASLSSGPAPGAGCVSPPLQREGTTTRGTFEARPLDRPALRTARDPQPPSADTSESVHRSSERLTSFSCVAGAVPDCSRCRTQNRLKQTKPLSGRRVRPGRLDGRAGRPGGGTLTRDDFYTPGHRLGPRLLRGPPAACAGPTVGNAR